MSHYIDPCGPFALAFKDLAAQKFTLQWIEAPEPQGTAIQPLKRLPPNTTPSEPIEADNEGISMPFEDEQTPSLHVPMPDKSNRLKYSCPGCSLNAWAKPGANLICGDCEEPMNYSN
jgi:hypothetical protein